MPRKSAEERGAAAYRAGGKAPEVPPEFSPEAAAIWREVVGSRPGDWFTPVSIGSVTSRAVCNAPRGLNVLIMRFA